MNYDITNKRQMYELLTAGVLGNTLPQYFSVVAWEASNPHPDLTWGIRSVALAGHDPRSRLNVPTADVRPYVIRHFAHAGEYNISLMVDPFVYFRGQVGCFDGLLQLEYVTGYPSQQNMPAGAHPWRYAFRYLAQHEEGSRARVRLKLALPENDYDDIQALIERFPEHTVEFSVANRCVGLIKGRQAVIWEVRRY